MTDAQYIMLRIWVGRMWSVWWMMTWVVVVMNVISRTSKRRLAPA